MSLQSRLSAFISAVGADIKALQQGSAATRARVRLATGSHTNSGNMQKVPFDTVVSDPDLIFDATNKRFVCNKAGPYVLGAQVTMAPNASGTDRVGVMAVNGAQVGSGKAPPHASAWARIALPAVTVHLNLGDYVEVFAYQDSGGTLAYLYDWDHGFGGGTGPLTWMNMVRVVGAKGDKGDPGDQQAFDTAPIGTVFPWTRQTIPSDFVLANGQRLTRALFPDAYVIAQAEVAAGNAMWTVRTSDETFTVPDLSNKFILAPGTRSAGATGGAETHTLTTAEIPSHNHDLPPATNTTDGGGFGASPDWYKSGNVQGPSTGRPTAGSTGSRGGGGAHNNMPPYLVLAQIVKVKGVVVSSEALQGPTGAAGPSVKAFSSDTPDPTSIINSATDNAVQWTRSSDGAWVAKVDPYLSVLTQTLEITSRAKTDGQNAQSILKAEENGTWNDFLALYFAGEYSSLEVTQQDSGTAEPRGSVVARSGANTRKIIDSAGGSDLQRAITTVTQLPSSPYDGQEVYLNVWSIMGDVIWHMRYTAWAAGTHKWLPIGHSAPARKVVGGSDVTRTITNTAYGELTSQSAVLSMLAPAAGNYEVEWGCAAWWNDSANAYVASAVGIGAFTTIPSNSRMKALYTASAAGFTEYGPRGYCVLSDLAKDDEIRIRFSRRAAVGTANVQEPLWMSIKPLQLSRIVV